MGRGPGKRRMHIIWKLPYQSHRKETEKGSFFLSCHVLALLGDSTTVEKGRMNSEGKQCLAQSF